MGVPSTHRSRRTAWQRAFTLALLASTALPSQAFSQAPGTLAAPKLAGEWAVEQKGRERWIPGQRQPRFTPFVTTHDWILVDSIRDAGTDRRLWLTLNRTAYGRDSALIVLDRAGHVAHLEFGRAPYRGRLSLFGDDSARWADLQRRAPRGNVRLGETRLWDLVPSTPPPEAILGARWTDTIARVAVEAPFHQAMRGTRTSHVIGERTFGGHQLLIVRDSATVTYEEQYPERERTLSGAQVSRIASGTITGVHLWDPALRLSRQSDDTTLLVGEAVLQYPDGRSFRTPARFERTLHRDLLDPSAYAARIAELNDFRSRTRGGMVRLPDEPLTIRLFRGDTTARDSLLSAWQRTTDPDSAESTFRLLEQWGARNRATRTLIDSVRLAAGDTAYLYRLLENRAYPHHPVDTTDVRAMLPFMADPGLPWRFDLSRDVLYENLVQSLTTWPPASGAGGVACTPAACRLLADQWSSGTEPRLRDVGLVARLVTDPARWTDTVLALDGPAHPLLHEAALLARGVGATWLASSHLPMPAAGSDWRAWLEWMDGRDPRAIATEKELAASTHTKADTLPHARFEQSHVTAIRFFQARTGRAIVAELRRGYDGATSDSARLVLGVMLQKLGALQLGEPELFALLRSGDATSFVLARETLPGAFARSATRTDSAAWMPLLEHVISAIVDTTPLWPRLDKGDSAIAGAVARLVMPRGRIALDTLGIPPRIRAEWGSRVPIMPSIAWTAQDPRESGVFYSIDPISTWGRFARVSLMATARVPRRADERPQAYGSSATYWLMNVDGQWKILFEIHGMT